MGLHLHVRWSLARTGRGCPAGGGGGGLMHWKRWGGGGPMGSYVSLAATASFNGICNRQ